MLLNHVTSHAERPRTVRYLDKMYTIPHATIIFALLGSLIPHTSPPSVHCNEWVHCNKSTVSYISYTPLSSWNLNPRANEYFMEKAVLNNHKYIIVCNKIQKGRTAVRTRPSYVVCATQQHIYLQHHEHNFGCEAPLNKHNSTELRLLRLSCQDASHVLFTQFISITVIRDNIHTLLGHSTFQHLQ